MGSSKQWKRIQLRKLERDKAKKKKKGQVNRKKRTWKDHYLGSQEVESCKKKRVAKIFTVLGHLMRIMPLELKIKMSLYISARGKSGIEVILKSIISIK